jgi:hypothetical protein
LKQAGHDVPDVCYAVLTYDDGAVVNLGVSYALPEKYPALGHAARVEILGPGDWALGEFWGPIANETRAWLDHLATGRPCTLATPQDARATLEATLAIEHSMRIGAPVTLPLRAG